MDIEGKNSLKHRTSSNQDKTANIVSDKAGDEAVKRFIGVCTQLVAQFIPVTVHSSHVRTWGLDQLGEKFEMILRKLWNFEMLSEK